jgi:ABC-2 type transport system permease protein
MQALVAVFWKELADDFTSRRFLILFPLVFLAAASAAYVAAQGLKPVYGGEGEVQAVRFVFLKLFTISSGALPSFREFIASLIPIVGIALGFDAINSENNSGTMSRLVSQPIYRDSIINGKFLAGVVTITIMLTSMILLISALGIGILGVAPSSEEAIRLIGFLAVSVIYGSFWLGLAILFSIFMQRMATSALASIAIWVFFAFFMLMIASVIADWLVPITEASNNATVLMRHTDVELMVMRVSPIGLFNEAGAVLLLPEMRTLGEIPPWIEVWLLDNPVSLGQSLLIVWRHLVTLLALTVVCFAIAYIKFMREEIRST